MLPSFHHYLLISGVLLVITVVIKSKRPSLPITHRISERDRISDRRYRDGRRSDRADGKEKKKVVIIGEMSDIVFEMATNASASTNYALDNVNFADRDYDDHDNDRSPPPPPPPPSRYNSSPRPIPSRGEWVRKRSPPYYDRRHVGHNPSGSVFVPVPASSVTHSRIGGGDSGFRRMRPVTSGYHPRLVPHGSSMSASSRHPGRTTESAVYGYVQKPEIVQFRGQYFSLHGSPYPLPHYRRAHYYPRDHYDHDRYEETASYHDPNYVVGPLPPYNRYHSDHDYEEHGKHKTIIVPRIQIFEKQPPQKQEEPIGTGGVLLAMLPLLLAPLLTMMIRPSVMTRHVTAGRRRRRDTNVHQIPPIVVGWTGDSSDDGGGHEWIFWKCVVGHHLHHCHGRFVPPRCLLFEPEHTVRTKFSSWEGETG